MVVLDYVRSSPCWNWDPISLLSPQQLRMVFVASTIIAAVATLFAVYFAGTAPAIPFLCSAGASHLCTYLVERYFIYEQALENHGRVVSDLRAALRTAEQSFARSTQHVAERQQQNSALEAQVGRLETAVPSLSQETQRFINSLQVETQQQKQQIVELRGLVQKLTEQNAVYEQTRIDFKASLAAAGGMHEDFREVNGEMQELQQEQRIVNRESHAAVLANFDQAVSTARLSLGAADAVDRIKIAAQDVVALEAESETRGQKLLQLRERIDGVRDEAFI